ncbi:MAG: hypothetical protein JJT75_15125 [Opitutales bacterium]|nr:hypothetical protein [Opitutales bacterium]
MAIEVTVNLDPQKAKAFLEGIMREGDQRDLNATLGKGLEQDTQRHFLAKNAKPNKKGWPKSNFWAEIRQATSYTGANADGAQVVISDRRLSPHVHGATLRSSRPGGFLAIPRRPEAKEAGRPALGKIPNLFLGRFPLLNRAFLARRRGDRLEVMYWLVPSVKVPKDPDALPNPEDLANTAVKRARSWLNRQEPSHG